MFTPLIAFPPASPFQATAFPDQDNANPPSTANFLCTGVCSVCRKPKASGRFGATAKPRPCLRVDASFCIRARSPSVVPPCPPSPAYGSNTSCRFDYGPPRLLGHTRRRVQTHAVRLARSSPTARVQLVQAVQIQRPFIQPHAPAPSRQRLSRSGAEQSYYDRFSVAWPVAEIGALAFGS